MNVACQKKSVTSRKGRAAAAAAASPSSSIAAASPMPTIPPVYANLHRTPLHASVDFGDGQKISCGFYMFVCFAFDAHICG